MKSTDKGNKETFWDYFNTSGKRKYKNTHALGDAYIAPASATGGTKITEGLYTIHHFPNPSYTSPAETTFVLSNKDGPLTVDYIIIGGGGGGGAGDPGAFAGGGGGGGAVKVTTGHPITNDNYPVVSGKGGTNTATPTAPAGSLDYNDLGTAQPGDSSSVFGVSAPGGGGGGGTGGAGDPGGSSGGGSHGNTTINTATGADWPGAAPLVSPPVGWGNPNHAGAPSYVAGGGGGAGSGGPPASRAGGAGIDLSPMVGTTFGGNPAADNNTASGGFFAGGGGAGNYNGPVKAAGGSGGGGPSGYQPNGSDGARAVLSTGSGGGGGDGGTGSQNPWNPPTQPHGTFGTGGGGGPGIVIIRYLTADLPN